MSPMLEHVLQAYEAVIRADVGFGIWFCSGSGVGACQRLELIERPYNLPNAW